MQRLAATTTRTAAQVAEKKAHDAAEVDQDKVAVCLVHYPLHTIIDF